MYRNVLVMQMHVGLCRLRVEPNILGDRKSCRHLMVCGVCMHGIAPKAPIVRPQSVSCRAQRIGVMFLPLRYCHESPLSSSLIKLLPKPSFLFSDDDVDVDVDPVL